MTEHDDAILVDATSMERSYTFFRPLYEFLFSDRARMLPPEMVDHIIQQYHDDFDHERKACTSVWMIRGSKYDVTIYGIASRRDDIKQVWQDMAHQSFVLVVIQYDVTTDPNDPKEIYEPNDYAPEFYGKYFYLIVWDHARDVYRQMETYDEAQVYLPVFQYV